MPADHFAAFGMPRRPWLDLQILKERFHRLTAAGHPDVGGDSQAFAALNAGYTVLREPALRLRHLLELEAPTAVAGFSSPIPSALADRFLNVATLRRAADAFIRQQNGADSPLAKALLASERFAIRRDVEKALLDLEATREGCLDAVRSVDEQWVTAKNELASQLAALQQELTYLEKWIGQLRESLVGLDG